MSTADSTQAALPQHLGAAQAGACLAPLEALLRQQPGPQVDLYADALQVFDSAAVAVVLELRRRLQLQGKHLALRGTPPPFAELLRIYGLSELLLPSAA